MKRILTLYLALILTYGLSPFNVEADTPKKQHAIAIYGDPKYPRDFNHFDYVNPKAPKGGEIKIGAIGVFDSLNPYSFKGVPAAGTGVLGPNLIHDMLMIPSGDEPETLYGLIAESVEMPEDRSWIIFNLNPKATFSDGKPVTAKDVAFTWKTLKEEGSSFLQSHYKKIEKIEIINDYRVKFYLKPKSEEKGKKTYARDLPLIVARMVVMPEHILKGKNFHKLKQEDIIGSGPYKIKSISMGRSITYERRKDYWAKDLNVRVGTNNFDTITYDYYRNGEVLFEAFKGGAFDIFIEIDPKRWANNYTIPAVKQGRIIKLELEHRRPTGFRGFVMNTRNKLFQDIRIRKALVAVFDFNWVNHNLYHDAFKRSRSYFENTYLAAQGSPSKAELKLLNPLKDQIPEEVFGPAFQPPVFKTPQEKRKAIAKAKKLLKAAGCTLKKGVLYHPATQKPFEFDIMITRTAEEQLALALQRDLKNLGIKLHIRKVDEAQYWARTTKFDFDMVIFQWAGSLSPSGGVLLNRWGTKSVNRKGSLNYMGVNNPAIDILCTHISRANSLDELKTAIHALDRLLIWSYFVIPLFHDNKNRMAIWDKFGYPVFNPLIGITTSTWWTK